MTHAEAQSRHAALVAQIRAHDQAYYVLAQPAISDREYDRLYRELLDLEREFPGLATSDSPSQRVGGAPTEGFARVQHLQPMLSLEKIEAADHPTKDEEPDRDKRNRLQDQNTVIGQSLFSASDFRKPSDLVSKLTKHADAISNYLWHQFSEDSRQALAKDGSIAKKLEGTGDRKEDKKSILIQEFNRILSQTALPEIECFSQLKIQNVMLTFQSRESKEVQLMRRNRLLLESVFPKEIATNGLGAFDAAMQESTGRTCIEYVLEPKVDGVSIGVHYRHGKLALGVTRGDGQLGDDITANLRTVRAIPLELNLKNPPALLEVRGEAYIATKDFEALNSRLEAAGEKSFPNARNATAGALKQLDPRLVSQRPISVVFYAVGACEGIEFETHARTLEALARFGLPTQQRWWLCKDIEEVIKCYYDEVICQYDEDRDLRRKLPYEIDGIVIKVNRIADWQRIPAKTRSPGYAIVHKPIPWITPAETVLKAITIQVGRTGVLTPVAELEPVFVQGSTISRATLHNEDEIRRKDLRIGDTVVIRKAGMVIPEVLEVVKTKRPPDAKEFDLFKHVHGKCPACDGPIAKEKASAGDAAEVAWRCQNVAGCPAQKTRRVEYFAQRKALDIESLGGVVAEKLVERGLVQEPLDLFNLNKEQLGKLNLGTDEEPRVFGEKNAAKVIEALERAKTQPLSRWLHALGIPNVGETTAYYIGKWHTDFQDIADSTLLKLVCDEGKLQKNVKEQSGDESIEQMAAQKEMAEREENTLISRQRAVWCSIRQEIERRSQTNEILRHEVEQERKLLSHEIASLIPEQEVLNKKAELHKQQQKEKAALNKEHQNGKSHEQRRKFKREKLPEELQKKRARVKGQLQTLEERLNKAGMTEELGPVVARSALDFFQSVTGKKILNRLKELEIWPQGGLARPRIGSPSPILPLVGKIFVLTGTLPTLSRDEASLLIREAGGSVVGSVSKHTDFLLAGENAGSKREKADELRVPILTEEKFLEMLGRQAKAEPKTGQGTLL